MIAGLLGEKLSHSYSPQIHRMLADYEYKLFEVEKNDVENFIKNGKWDALNVTIPYKKIALELSDIKSDIAKRIGSANTLVRRNGKIYATNTDYYGFKSLLNTINVKKKNKALILGTGGASLAVRAVLEDEGYDKIIFISRLSQSDNYQNIQKHSDAGIIVNTTPVGMYPDTLKTPLEHLERFEKLEAVFDLIYNPKRTLLSLLCEKRGIKYQTGLFMLVAQASQSAYEFDNIPVDNYKIQAITNILDKKMQNIVLIGMPGSGKSTIAKEISNITKRCLIDTDFEFQKKYKITPGEFITKYSEAEFREKETQIIKEFSKKSGNVISTGGGVVEREENYFPLRQNSTIFYIKRPLDKLDLRSRPLSKNISELFSRRSPLYEKFADYSVENDSTVSFSAKSIMDIFNKI